MKILFYINTLGIGGAERAIKNLAERFKDVGAESVMVTSYPVGNGYLLSHGVKAINLFDEKPKGKFSKNVKYIKALKRVVEEETPDIVVSFMPEPNFRAIISTKGKNIPTFVSVRNDPKREYKSFIYRFLAKNLYKKASGVIFQTEDAKAFFPAEIRDKSKVIFNQVGEDFFKVEREKETKGIVSFGRYVPQKNHALLLRAYAKIADLTDENLFLYGKGPLKSELENLAVDLGISNRVHILDAVDSVTEKLSAAKLFVLSSDYEGMPNALMEAMAAGLPCVSTDCPCGGPKAMIESGKDGILVPVGDEKALADAMLKVLTDGEFAETLGRNAKAKAKKLFAPEVVFNEWKDFILGRTAK